MRAARRTDGERRRAADGPRPLQGDQRHARPRRRRRAAASSSARRLRARAARVGHGRPPRRRRVRRAAPATAELPEDVAARRRAHAGGARGAGRPSQGLPLARRGARSASRSSPTTASDVETLLQRADVAMYHGEGRARRLRVLRRASCDDARPAPADARRRAAPRARARRARRSTTSRRRVLADGAVRSRRGAAALEPPGARARRPRRVHPARRADRPDRRR